MWLMSFRSLKVLLNAHPKIKLKQLWEAVSEILHFYTFPDSQGCVCLVALLFRLSLKVIQVCPCCFSPTVCSTRVPAQAVERMRLCNMPQHMSVGPPLVWIKTRQLIWISEKCRWDESPSFYNLHHLFSVFFHKDAEEETGCHLVLSYPHSVSCNDLKVYVGNIAITLFHPVIIDSCCIVYKGGKM